MQLKYTTSQNILKTMQKKLLQVYFRYLKPLLFKKNRHYYQNIIYKKTALLLSPQIMQ